MKARVIFVGSQVSGGAFRQKKRKSSLDFAAF